MVGYEALLRAVDDKRQPVSPLELFARVDNDTAALLRLDRLCQSLHVRNFSDAAPGNRWLFLNLDPATITSRSYYDGRLTDALAHYGLSASLLVIEILEKEIDESLLREAVEYFRSIGALVALDDFGSGHSNFDRIWRLAPDIVKLDRTLIVEAEQHGNSRLRQVLPNLVSLMHEAGALVLAEGIETDTQALIAIDADVDFVQGFHFARPDATIDCDTHTSHPRLESITSRFAERARAEDSISRQTIAPYVDVFRAVADVVIKGASLADSCISLLAMERTQRCYLLNEWGEELVHFTALIQERSESVQSGPIADTSGGTWFRRHYFRDAMSDPRRHKISRPYLSCTGTDMVITLSIAYDDVPRRVFCCDIRA